MTRLQYILRLALAFQFHTLFFSLLRLSFPVSITLSAKDEMLQGSQYGGAVSQAQILREIHMWKSYVEEELKM